MLAKIQYAQDLHAPDAVYHQECSVNFRTFKQIPKHMHKNMAIVQCVQSNAKSAGDHLTHRKSDAFRHVTKYLEENYE